MKLQSSKCCKLDVEDPITIRIVIAIIINVPASAAAAAAATTATATITSVTVINPNLESLRSAVHMLCLI
eukprot:gene10087-biopygen4906